MKKFCLMAIAKGKESKEVEVKRFKGTAAVGVEAINPTKDELSSIYGRTSLDKEPVYVGTTTVKNYRGEDVTVPQVRINLITKVDPTIKRNNGVDAIIPVTIFLSKEYSYSSKNGVTKVKVIDPYGRTSWVTSEELKAGAIPEFEIHNGPNAGKKMKARLAPGYRRCYIGEDQLVQFLINYLNLPAPDTYNEETGQFTLKSPKELEDSECMLEHINSYFEGNVKELKEVFKFQPNNRLLVNFGIKTNKEGNQYQCAYLQYTGKLANTRFNEELGKKLKDDAQYGRHPSEEYSATDIQEYKLESSTYEAPQQSVSDPFAGSAPAIAAEIDDLPMDTDPFA